MGLTDRFRAAIQTFRTTNNTVGADVGLAREFLRHGNRKPLVQDWSQVLMSDQDLYTGYSFAAINNRATAVAEMAIDNLKTQAKQNIMDVARQKDELLLHPYLDIIDRSDDFADYFFWYTVPTYLDLKGVYYLMAVRTVQEQANGKVRVGNIQEFKMLNPYEVRRIRNENTMEIGGYVETRDGKIREIPPQMIIEIRRLNPFSRDDPFSLSSAMKDSQFTLKQAGDYTRHSLKNNMAAPGIISTDVKLDEQQFKNFVARVTNQEKGLPLFGDGSGSITWNSMQIEMDKAALDKINEINRSIMFAASGVGKTMMAIEESGTTRETAKVARDNFIRQHGIPLLRWITDALNQDYKRYYRDQYEKNGYKIYIDSPLGADRDAELKDVEIRKGSYEMYSVLVNKGYEREIAAKYANGQIMLEELGQPTNEPVSIIPVSVTPPATATDTPPTDQPPTQATATKEAKNFNPNHDKSGRFGAGIGGGYNLMGKDVAPEKANKYIGNSYSDSTYTPEEQGAVHSYTGSGFVSANNYLRHGQEANPRLVEDVKNLKSVTMKNSLKEDTTLFRFAGTTRSLKKGEIFSDKGFGSTSLSRSVPEEMVNHSTAATKSILKINARKGTSGVFPKALGVNNAEAEFIVHPNAIYKIKKVSRKQDYNLVEADLL